MSGFKQLNDCYIYKHLNNNDIITKTVMNALQHGKEVGKENLEEPMLTIEKHFKYPLKFDVLDALQKKEIVLIYIENKPLPTSMPFFLTRINNEIKAVVCVNTYGTYNKSTKQFSIDPKKLYCLLEGAFLARRLTLAPKGIPSRAIGLSSEIYSQMFVRILNKKYSLNMDKNKLNKVVYTVSRFFLENIMGLEPSQMVNNMAMKNCISPNPILLRELEEQLANNPQVLSSLPDLINALNLPGLTVRGFLEQWIYQYDASAILALESFPYFIYNVIAVTNAAFINNQYTLEDIVGSNGSKIYVDLANYYR